MEKHGPKKRRRTTKRSYTDSLPTQTVAQIHTAMIELLIECVRNQPCIYDTTHPSYANTSIKPKVWEEIGKEINESGDVARKKWKSLRDNYLRYKKEIADTSGKNPRKFAKWPWSSKLQFLDVNEYHRNIVEVSLPGHENTTENTSVGETEMIFQGKTEIVSPDSSEMGSPEESAPNSPPPLTRRPRGKNAKTDSTINEFMSINIPVQTNSQHDAIDLLFQSYAETFKSFTKQNQIRAKVEMAKMFANIEAEDMQEQVKYNPEWCDRLDIG